MDSKKRLMFSLEEDYYYITLKILLILKHYECDKNPFIDYRKLSILFEIIKDEKTNHFVDGLIKKNFSDINLVDNDRIVDIVCNSKLNVPVIKRILLFLESKGIIQLFKNSKKNSIDVKLIKNSDAFEMLESENFSNDMERIRMIKEHVPNARWVKFRTLKEKLFGGNEVIKWDD
ncbi:hypothetical protein Amet_0845 [Alkaliphilus metalliredigens QYMF]|uniref:Uncharacterized protein n=1 Tax=Alkaliphilus metalliredigens (strain QYMF) TaxID=293826 RepID=A6TLK2_ALKMQ|nr:hypothetical protein [Alkaliphilus metalliredigens]ABR47070.1 hypothetical protein Amet_0845 [Alkaliphilus metalliredigens QYMF]